MCIHNVSKTKSVIEGVNHGEGPCCEKLRRLRMQLNSSCSSKHTPCLWKLTYRIELEKLKVRKNDSKRLRELLITIPRLLVFLLIILPLIFLTSDLWFNNTNYFPIRCIIIFLHLQILHYFIVVVRVLVWGRFGKNCSSWLSNPRCI